MKFGAFLLPSAAFSSPEGSGKQEEKRELLLPSPEDHYMLQQPGVFLQKNVSETSDFTQTDQLSMSEIHSYPFIYSNML